MQPLELTNDVHEHAKVGKLVAFHCPLNKKLEPKWLRTDGAR
eukprot:CAMPEP_0185903172 /NCGR_PEP_ID=MMETSP0196C-20130402/2379_1 /TAXON_ID=2932 /ORGANISM="Alexandrium fundyense, Strain CCMP1719" /LENGTH=41 /DNA_ID= /DNA_START= /DNA_END= /DNA_ORIENTATION=